MFWFIKQVFIAVLLFKQSLSSIDNTLYHIKCISLNNQQHMSLISLHTNEYIEGLYYYEFAVN